MLDTAINIQEVIPQYIDIKINCCARSFKAELLFLQKNRIKDLPFPRPLAGLCLNSKRASLTLMGPCVDVGTWNWKFSVP